MRPGRFIVTASISLTIVSGSLSAQRGQVTQVAANDPVKTLSARLDLEKYKAIMKSLTQFGDRREGTERNRKAVDWIEAQLQSYGCKNTERIKYLVPDPAATPRRGAAPAGQGGQATRSVGGVGRQAKVIESGEIIAGQGGSRLYGVSAAVGPITMRTASLMPGCESSMPSLPRMEHARRFIARKSGLYIRKRCISLALTWMALAGVRR